MEAPTPEAAKPETDLKPYIGRLGRLSGNRDDTAILTLPVGFSGTFAEIDAVAARLAAAADEGREQVRQRVVAAVQAATPAPVTALRLRARLDAAQAELQALQVTRKQARRSLPECLQNGEDPSATEKLIDECDERIPTMKRRIDILTADLAKTETDHAELAKAAQTDAERAALTELAAELKLKLEAVMGRMAEALEALPELHQIRAAVEWVEKRATYYVE